MRYVEAKKLKFQDEITIKSKGIVISVTDVQVYEKEKEVYIEGMDIDGNTYKLRHDEVRLGGSIY